jgi:hypothetical protein
MYESNLHSDVVDALHHGRTVIGASAVQLIALMPSAIKGIQLKAGPTNTGIIYVGKAGVTDGDTVATDGIPLQASEGLFVPIKDVTLLYAIASAASQDLYWLVV